MASRQVAGRRTDQGGQTGSRINHFTFVNDTISSIYLHLSDDIVLV